LILRIDHVLFGSDFGFGNDYLARTVIDITELALDETAVRMLYADHARRVPRLQSESGR
jgi:hypothetical protein